MTTAKTYVVALLKGLHFLLSRSRKQLPTRGSDGGPWATERFWSAGCLAARLRALPPTVSGSLPRDGLAPK